MAEKFQHDIEDVCKCALCLETYHDPKSLPCRHSFCSECLHNLVKFNMYGSTIKCPTCQKEHSFPKDTTVSNMDTELILIQLLDVLNSSSVNQGKASETLLECSTEDCEQAPSSLCLECYSQLCRKCDLKHDSCTKKVEIKESKVSGTEKFYCKMHACFINKFCWNCQKYLCMYCAEWKLDCKRHKLISMEELETRCREELKAYEKILGKYIALVQKRHIEIVCWQEEKLTKMENEICVLAENLKKSLEERVDSLKDKYIENLRESVEECSVEAEGTLKNLEWSKSDIESSTLSTNLTCPELAFKIGYIGKELLVSNTWFLHKECNFTVDISDCNSELTDSTNLASFFGKINISFNSHLWKSIKPDLNDVTYVKIPDCMTENDIDTLFLYLNFPINSIAGEYIGLEKSKVDISWLLKVKKNESFLCVFVEADLLDYKWCEASIEFIARNFRDTDEIKTVNHLFTAESHVSCLYNFLPLHVLTRENGFVTNGEVPIEVLVTINSFEKNTHLSDE